jgi:hypothetical protein
MTNLLSTGSAWLASKLKSHASQDATYYFRGGATCSLSVTVGTSEFTRGRADDIVSEARVVDFLFEAADLLLNDEQVEPRAGDIIKTTHNGSESRFEVVSPGGDEPAWRFSDPNRVRVRVHTREIS